MWSQSVFPLRLSVNNSTPWSVAQGKLFYGSMGLKSTDISVMVLAKPPAENVPVAG